MDQEGSVPDPAYIVVGLSSPRSPLSIGYYSPGSSQLNLQRCTARHRLHTHSAVSSPWAAIAAMQLACEEDEAVLVMDNELLPETGSPVSHLRSSPYTYASSSSPFCFPGGVSSTGSRTGLGTLSVGESSDSPLLCCCVPAWWQFTVSLSCNLSCEFGGQSPFDSGITCISQHYDPQSGGEEEIRYAPTVGNQSMLRHRQRSMIT